MTRYSIETSQEQENILKDIAFYHLQKKYKKELLETGLNASRKVGNKTGEFQEIKFQRQ